MSQAFFSFRHCDRTYPCVLIHWFSKISEEPNVNTGMWWVEPNFNAKGDALYVVIHLDAMIHAAHLIGESNVPLSTLITYVSALDMFDIFYVSKYLDHHAYEMAF